MVRYRFSSFFLASCCGGFGILLAQEALRRAYYIQLNCIAGQMNRTYQSGITLISDAGTRATIFWFYVLQFAWLMAEAVIKRQDGAMFCFVAFPCGDMLTA